MPETELEFGLVASSVHTAGAYSRQNSSGERGSCLLYTRGRGMLVGVRPGRRDTIWMTR